MNAVIGSAAAALGLAAACLANGPASAQSPPVQVMSDTPEYCTTLRDRIDQMQRAAPRPVLDEVRSLEREGRRLCDAGETRGGILRLRHALMLMMRPSRDDDADE